MGRVAPEVVNQQEELVTRSYQVSKGLSKKLKEIAYREDRSQASIVREAVETLLKRKELEETLKCSQGRVKK